MWDSPCLTSQKLGLVSGSDSETTYFSYGYSTLSEKKFEPFWKLNKFCVLPLSISPDLNYFSALFSLSRSTCHSSSPSFTIVWNKLISQNSLENTKEKLNK